MVFSNTNVLQQSKKSIYFNILSTRTSAETKFLFPKPSNHWNMEHHRGSADCGEVDIDSDINHLDSGNVWQYTTVPSQCEWFPWTWTFLLWYEVDDLPGKKPFKSWLKNTGVLLEMRSKTDIKKMKCWSPGQLLTLTGYSSVLPNITWNQAIYVWVKIYLTSIGWPG